ncbi:DEKNAAC100006 [Brettanomyces naardenensis]|uniref:Phosphatidylglycerol/phosphatidylinositol transfer protein n=1 Tax=Brettanomyces naardenensis TaxID=13370 RepID=A0A448YEL5_BRENA|nr:DEKNAAC100006 [Brettanomyces naardenensis]
MLRTLLLQALLLTIVCGSSVQHLLKAANLESSNEPIPGESPLELCDADYSQILSLDSVRMDPVPPERGQNLTIIAIGTLSEAIEEGSYVDVDVNYGYIKLIHTTYDLCDELPNVDLQCPIKKGPHTIEKEVAIPNEVPPGKYVVIARAYTKNDDLITCLTGEVEFPPYGALEAGDE